MFALRSPLSVALNDTRLVAVAVVVVLVETTVRVLLAALWNPLVALAAPPLVTAAGLGAVTPRNPPDATPSNSGRSDITRSIANGNAAASATGVVPIGFVRDRLPRIVAIATIGHAVALAGGLALFVLVDTPAKAAIYWLGRGDVLGIGWLVAWPTVGVTAGTFLAWSAVAGAVTDAALEAEEVETRGEKPPLRGAVERVATAVVRSLAAPRSTAVVVGCHLLPVVIGVLGAATILVLGSPRMRESAGIALMAAVALGAIALIGISMAFLTALHAHRSVREAVNADPDGGSTVESLPVRRVALALLVVSALVVGAGAVRVTETRPVDATPEPLPEDPDALYATALANTERASHDYRVAVDAGSEEPFIVGHRIDREDRRYRQYLRGEAVGPEVYASTGVGSPPPRTGVAAYALGTRTAPETDQSVAALPAYVHWDVRYEWEAGGLNPPAAVEGWEVIDRGDDRLVLELADPEAVYYAAQGRRPSDVTDVSSSRIRATVDRDRGTLRSVDVRLNATLVHDGESRRYDADVRHEFTVDSDVERPDELGSPSLGEWIWRLLVF